MDTVLAKNRIQGFVPQTEGDLKNFYQINILDNFKSFLFCFHIFVVRRSIDVLDLETSLDPELPRISMQ